LKKDTKSEVKADKIVQSEDMQEVTDEPKNDRYIDCPIKEQETILKQALKIIEDWKGHC
jgi:hypothetical protein